MGLPYRSITVLAAGVGYALSSDLISTPQLPRLGFTAGFLAAWTLQFWLWAFWAVVLYPKFFSPLRHLPSPDDGSFYNGQWEKISALPSGVPMIEWINSIPNNGLIRYLGILNLERVMVTSPKALAEVLTTKCYDFEKPEQLRWSLGRILGIGILFAEGDEHNIQRRKLMPAFSFRHIKDLYPVFWSKSKESVEAMTSTVLNDSPVLEVGSWASRATLDMIGVAGLGRDFNAIADPSNPLSQTYQSLFKPSAQGRLLGLISLFLPGWFVDKLPVSRNNDVHHAVRLIRSVCSDLIQNAKTKLSLSSDSDPPSVDILSVALQSGSFTDSNLVDQMMTFLLAGHETTASAMTWACYLLAKHPEIQTRLRHEIHANLPPASSDKPITSSDIDALPYLHAVCSEVLRYFAPVALLMRDAARDTTIQGVFIPKGTRIVITPWAINKSVEMWGEDALEFTPERWMDGPGKKAASGGASSNYAFMTFLAGPRGCIGRGFAEAEFKCLLASWVGRFRMALENEEERDEGNLEIKGAITARPARGMFVRMEVVEGW